MFWDIFPWPSLGGSPTNYFQKSCWEYPKKNPKDLWEIPNPTIWIKIPATSESMHYSEIFCAEYPGHFLIFSISIFWLCFINICTKYPWRNLGVIPQVLPNKNSEKKIFTKNLWTEITAQKYLQRNLYQESQKSNSLPNKLGKNIFQNKLWRQSIYQTCLKRNHYQKICEKIYQISLQRHSPPKDWKEESLPKTSANIFAKVSLKNLYQKLFEKKSMPNKFQQKPLPKKKWKNRFYHKIS